MSSIGSPSSFIDGPLVEPLHEAEPVPSSHPDSSVPATSSFGPVYSARINSTQLQQAPTPSRSLFRTFTDRFSTFTNSVSLLFGYRSSSATQARQNEAPAAIAHFNQLSPAQRNATTARLTARFAQHNAANHQYVYDAARPPREDHFSRESDMMPSFLANTHRPQNLVLSGTGTRGLNNQIFEPQQALYDPEDVAEATPADDIHEAELIGESPILPGDEIISVTPAISEQDDVPTATALPVAPEPELEFGILKATPADYRTSPGPGASRIERSGMYQIASPIEKNRSLPTATAEIPTAVAEEFIPNNNFPLPAARAQIKSSNGSPG